MRNGPLPSCGSWARCETRLHAPRRLVDRPHVDRRRPHLQEYRSITVIWTMRRRLNTSALIGPIAEFVQETRVLESSDLHETVARHRRAILSLRQCRDLAKEKGLEKYGFLANQTDAIPLDRLVKCRLKMGKHRSRCYGAG